MGKEGGHLWVNKKGGHESHDPPTVQFVKSCSL